MPCECGPDIRSLWEQVRDFMQHHDELYDQYKQLETDNAMLKEENRKLKEKLTEKVMNG